MFARSNFILSFGLSAALHGAVAVGVYSFVSSSGPDISLAGGGGSPTTYTVSIVSESSLAQSEVARSEVKISDARTNMPLDLKPQRLKLEELKRVTLAPAPEVRASYKSRPSKSSESPVKNVSYPSLPQLSLLDQPNSCQAAQGCNGLPGPAVPGPGSGYSQGSSPMVAPKPPYPWAARRAGFEGSVELDLDIAASGAVSLARIVQSSGREDCDKSALETITQKWKFSPATKNGVPIDWKEKVVVVYSLKNQ